MTCFDPLQKQQLHPAGEPPPVGSAAEDGQIILLSSESIPDILQTLEASPRDVMALYAKVEKKSNGGGGGGVIVNELSNLLLDKKDAANALDNKPLIFQKEHREAAAVDEADEGCIPAVPLDSYISVANTNVDQNI